MAVQNITSAKPFLGCYVKRLSSNFGINTSPSTLEIDLVPGNPWDPEDASGLSTGGIIVTGFDRPGALPGNMSGLDWGEFKFAGIIQSWNENWSSNGRTYTVRMADPRSVFNNVQLILDGGFSIDRGYLSSGITNYFDPLHAYVDKVDADINEDGINFHKVRRYLENSGIISVYGNTFSLRFASGFLPSGIPSDEVNPSGIPSWYRLPAAQLSLDQMLQQISQDFQLDYYVEVGYDDYLSNPTGVIPLDIKLIDRRDATGTITDIDTFVTNATNSGTLISYRKGQELTNEPNTLVVQGPPLRYWQTPSHTTNQMYRYWGRSNAGFPLVTEVESDAGIVLLDHIIGTEAASITSTVTLNNRVYSKSPNPSGELYPPRISVSTSGETVKGYQPNDLTMRAALFNQESWEAILYKEHESFANQLGIYGPPVKSKTQFLNKINEYLNLADENPGFSLLYTVLALNEPVANYGSGITLRSDSKEELISAVYEATKEVAEEHYGKSWLVKLGDSDWIRSSTFYGTDLIQSIEFEVTDSAFSQGFGGGTYPNNILNHELLHRYGNSNFRDNLGNLKAFVSLNDYNDFSNGYIAGFWEYPIDTVDIPRNEFLIEQGDKLVLPIEVEQLNVYPASGIVRTRVPIKGQVSTSGYDDRTAFYEFITQFGYTAEDLHPTGYDIGNRLGENFTFGLAEPRLPYIISVEENYGIHIPIQSKIRSFGPFLGSGVRTGGTKILSDSSLAPWSFGSNDNFNSAGAELAGVAFTTSSVVDSADISLAGLPDYNLGSSIGDSSRITNLSIQLGADGLTTNLSIKTFVLPSSRISKLLQDRILGVIVREAQDRRQLIRIDRKLSELDNKIQRADDVRQASGKDPKDRRNTDEDYNYSMGFER